VPIISSAKKALRKDKRRAVVNLRLKRKMKAALKKAKEKPTKKNLALGYSALDRAAKKHFIHKSKASRLKSRLMKFVLKSKPSKASPKKH